AARRSQRSGRGTVATLTMERARLSHWIGGLLVLLGIVTMLDWWLELGILIQVVAVRGLPMVFNTGVCFVLAGAALMVPHRSSHRIALTTLLGSAIVCIATLVLIEHLFNVDIGIDWAALHNRPYHFNPKPGRMSPITAIAFLMA